MPWNEPGGDKDPWSGNKKKSTDNNPADKVTELFSNMSKGGGGGGKLLYFLPLIALAIWAFSGVYQLESGKQGVVLQFGKFKEITTPGLHWIARPIQTVEIVDMQRNRSANDQTTMLTMDENIVDLEVEVQYLVDDAKAYLFNVMLPDFERDQSQGVLYQVMRSAIREVVGASDMDFIIKEGRTEIEEKTKELMQSILSEYKTGLQIVKVNLTYAEAPKEVKDAFDDANRAREDFNRSKNRAETYSNKVIPDARGKGARLVEEAKAYRDQVIAKSEGDASRFSNLVAEYQKAPEVTRQRLYLDTMEKVMSGSKKIMMDTTSGNNMFYLPLNTDGGASEQGSVPPPVSPSVLERLKREKDAAEANRQAASRTTLREGR
ncbi:MAG: HflK protein [uncultured Thiotrichaceae bacterium]|uniref:Protein HflK n=1 Tax=uncultured Thiotrichaceae bacterium TaxID=298394 RepID=A0A6S6TIQ5_9GAMM|nr:MAG: HflK protein [uncultured Thiotrichaceae bacterium]